MHRVRSTKGKKRAREEDGLLAIPRSLSPASSSSLSPVPDKESAPPVKKPKRAETRPCPVCSELIPIRLLPAHAELELQRVEEIIRHVGDADVLAEVDALEEGPSSKPRRSALKARKSLTALQPAPHSTMPTTIVHTISHITRRRKARHARLKELAREDEVWISPQPDGGEEGGVTCPVCLQTVRGDTDVVEAHVDACLAYESRRAEVARQTGPGGGEDVDVDVDADFGEGSVHTRVITSASLRGTGIHVRPHSLDTEDDIDVDGTDDAIFGIAQFGEEDVLGIISQAQTGNGNGDVDVGSDDGVDVNGNDDERKSEKMTERSNHDHTDKLDLAILAARSRSDYLALITALEAKLKSIPPPPTCRICLSSYVDPTVSTGCWHTCCAMCWLQCLGSTKLCPMCQRITGANELRRVYL
ncbi:hypothetical protein F5I97DRAFT_1935628 [Phlebopus sp. FC_14]|nr:hypothetical protein F5I97DRAFT_1935628 [Phlebopus sp. FC_14]